MPVATVASPPGPPPAAPGCRNCASTLRPAARFCAVCGWSTDAARPGDGRNGAFAGNPAEPAHAPVTLSTLLPHASGPSYHAYRFILAAMVAVTLGAASVGQIGFAMTTAALTVPIFYALYMLDVNVWEDQPAAVLGLVGLGTAAVGALTTRAIEELTERGGLAAEVVTGDLDARRLLSLGLVTPVVALVAAQVGPALLCRLPRFHHLLDGLTFGVLAGASYVAGETLVEHRGVFSAVARHGVSSSIGSWTSTLLNAALIRPLLVGALAAIALAEFCGVGPGVGRLSARYARTLGVVLAAGVVYSVGLTWTSTIEGAGGSVLGTLWGIAALLAAVLVLRTQLHRALLEEAADARAAHTSLPDHAPGRTTCPNCAAPTDPATDRFCPGCGMATLASSKTSSTRARTSATERRDASAEHTTTAGAASDV